MMLLTSLIDDVVIKLADVIRGGAGRAGASLACDSCVLAIAVIKSKFWSSYKSFREDIKQDRACRKNTQKKKLPRW